MSSADAEPENKLSQDAITESSLDLSPGITEDDKILWRKDKNAVEFSLNYAKLWCKFCKELVVALEKKANFENEMFRSWSKLFQSFEGTVSSSAMFGAPMRSVSLMMSKLIIDQCKEVEAQNTKKLGKLLDVINRQRTEFSKTRKHYKEKWKSDCKKMMDAENVMLKTKSAYYQRCQQGVKLREELTIAQASLTYMQEHGVQDAAASNVTTPINATNSFNSSNVEGMGSSVNLPSPPNPMPNDCISASQISKQKLKVDKLEKQLADNDKKEIEQMYAYKESVESANNKLIEYEKKKMEHVCDIRLMTYRSDEIVKDKLAEYLRTLADTRTAILNEYGKISNKFQEYKPCHEYRCLIEKQTSNKPDVYSEKFQVELFHDCPTSKEKPESQGTKGLSRFSIGNSKDVDHDSNRPNRSILQSHSDSDSDTEITSTTDGTVATGSNRTGVLNTIVEFGSNLFRQGGGGSANASNEGGRRNQTVKGKKSTSGSTSSMGGSAEGLGEKDLEWQKEVDAVIEIILKCIEIIELNGLATHGIYRISASKLKVGSVMESLNNQGIDTDLINEHPITLANVVKSKLISLSEPLVPYNLYNEFVDLGKEAESGEIVDLVNRLKALIIQLPPPNKRLAGLVFHHLRKIANNSEENQMGSANLGTLFAPTLIKAKPRFRMADIKEYMDNKSQAKIVQVIIENVEFLFGSEEQYYITGLSMDDNEELKIEFNLKSFKSVEEKEVGLIQIENKESNTKSKIKPRPYSSIIEITDNIQTMTESASIEPTTESLTVPVLSTQSTSNIRCNRSDKSAPKMMDMLMSVETASTIRSVSPRPRKHTKETTVDTEKPVLDISIMDKTSPSLPHRSISLGSGPLPGSIKLAQLSKPSSDSIFSKFKDQDDTNIAEETSSSAYKSADRYNNLKRSFISSNYSGNILKSDPSSPDAGMEPNLRSSNSVLNRSRPASAITRSSHNYSITDSPVFSSSEQIENISLKAFYSFDILHKTFCTLPSSCVAFNQSKITPQLRRVSRSKSHAISVEPHNKSLYRHSSTNLSPFVRQSNIRVPLSAKSLVNLSMKNQIVKNENLESSLGESNFFVKFPSVDNLNNLSRFNVNNKAEWLSQTVPGEFYV